MTGEGTRTMILDLAPLATSTPAAAAGFVNS